MAVKKTRATIRLNDDLYERLKLIATLENRSISNLVEVVLQKFVEGYEAK